jgi:hypothetical protein
MLNNIIKYFIIRLYGHQLKIIKKQEIMSLIAKKISCIIMSTKLIILFKTYFIHLYIFFIVNIFSTKRFFFQLFKYTDLYYGINYYGVKVFVELWKYI